MTSKQTRWKVLAVIAFVVVLADQWSKLWAVEHLTPGLANAAIAPARVESYEQRGEVLADVGFVRKVELFYGVVEHPCTRAGTLCPEVKVVDGFWSWRYAENTGAAWSILSDQRFLLLAFTLIAVAFIVSFVRKLEEGQGLLLIALSLVLGGAVGNLIDRLHLGYVVDFILWYRDTFYWPTFNVADSAISTGVGLILLSSLVEAIQKWRKRKVTLLAGEERG